MAEILFRREVIVIHGRGWVYLSSDAQGDSLTGYARKSVLIDRKIYLDFGRGAPCCP